MVSRAEEKGVDPDRLTLFPNWVDVSAIRPLEKPSVYRASLGIAHDACVILYAGNLGAKQGLEVVADAAALLKNIANIVIVFCGQGATKQALEARCADLPNVRFIPLQPLEKLQELLGMADIHILPQRADAADLVLPSKLTGMLASGRPIIATTYPETGLGKVVEHCGRLVNPGDAKALADAIIQLMQDPVTRRFLGAAGRRYAETHLGVDEIIGEFERELQALVLKHQTPSNRTAATSVAGD